MPNQLQMAGSPGKPLKFVPIYTSRFFQGLWTQRNPLRSGAIGWQAEKYYGANNDCLVDGSNVEISNRLTLIRRPGTSVYNNNNFPPVLSFYSFRLFSTTSEAIKVIVDTVSKIYDGTGMVSPPTGAPGTFKEIYTKTHPGNAARFLSIGNILYFGDGDVDKKWIQSLNGWVPSTSYNISDYFIDSNGNIQVFADLAIFRETSFFTLASTSSTGTQVKARYYSNGRGGNGIGVPGSIMSFSDLSVKTVLNGNNKVGTLVSDLPITPYSQIFIQSGSQSVTDNVLTVSVDLGTTPTGFEFPVGSRVTFTGVVDSTTGGGGIVLSSSINGTIVTFTMTYLHPDYATISNSLHNITAFYGDRELTITLAAGSSWTDTQDTGFACVGSSGTVLGSITNVTIASNVLTLTSAGFRATLLPYTKVTFSAFAGALAFLNGTTGYTLSCSTTACTIAYTHTDLPTTAGGGTVTTTNTLQSAATITNVTITNGIADFTSVNNFHVGDVIKLSGLTTVPSLNGKSFPCTFTNGTSFHVHVSTANVGSAAETGTGQEQYGYLTIEGGTMTVTQPNPFTVGQSVLFSGFTIAAFLNGGSILVTTRTANQYTGPYPQGTASITSVSVNGANVATITAANQYQAGQFVTITSNYSGLGSGATPYYAKVISATSSNFTISFTHALDAGTPTDGFAYLFYSTMTDVGGKMSTVPGSSGSATTSTSSPDFNNLDGASVFEQNIEWVNHGSNLQKMGLDGPVLPPTISIQSLPAPPTLATWAAATYFGQAGAGAISIVDNSVGPYVQQVTQSGITGGSQPVWNTTVGGTTADGTVTWTNKGLAGRIQNNVYQVGDRVAVTYYLQTIVGYSGSSGYTGAGGYSGDTRIGGQYSPGGSTTGFPIYATTGPFRSFFTCTVGGTSLDAPSSSVVWSNSPGQVVVDGTVTWKNTGTLVNWPGATVDLSKSGVGSIVDSNGNVQKVSVAGTSGATVPTWATAQGVTTIDGTVVWVNDGPSAGGTSTTPDTVPGKWYYGYAFKNSFTNEVSNMSPISNPVIPQVGGSVSVSGVGSSDPQYDTISIYRTLQGGSTFFWIADISALTIHGGQWTYLDVSPDPPAPGATMNLLITAAVNLENTPPPNGMTNFAFHLNRIWGSVGNIVVFSNPPGFSVGSNYTQFPPSNYFTFSSKVTRLWPVGTAGILVLTVSDIYIISGTTTLAFSPAPFLKGVGLLNYNAMSVMGSIICMFTADGQLITLDPNSGVTEVGFPIGNLINQNFNPALAYVSWHVSGSQDKALYLADGSTGWHRLSPTAAPESGLMWAPFATIVGGTSAVQSIEVSPGVFRLLIGS